MVFAKSRHKAERVLEVIREIIEGDLKLTLHAEKTVITNFGRGFTFLGYEFIAWRYMRPRGKALKRFKDRVREVTRRQQPWPVETIIARLNPVIRGWGNCFGKGNVKKRFARLDEWIKDATSSLYGTQKGSKASEPPHTQCRTAEQGSDLTARLFALSGSKIHSRGDAV